MASDTGFLKKLIKRITIIEDQEIIVGIIGTGEGELATYASANEYGTNKAGKNRNVTIPERSFIRSTFDSKRSTNKALRTFDNVFALNFDQDLAFDNAGEVMVGEIKNKIASNISPANAPSTKAKKRGSGKTLIDTGDMRKAINYKVL